MYYLMFVYENQLYSLEFDGMEAANNAKTAIKNFLGHTDVEILIIPKVIR